MTKILVIEDEAGIRDSIVDILHAEDYIVDSAANGVEGFKMVSEFHPDLILCDVMMPMLDGHGLLEKVRQDANTKTIPFVFLTAKADKGDFRAGMDLGADDYLTKPFTHDELLRTIQTRLGLLAAATEQTEQELEVLRSSINMALPRELGGPLEEISTLSRSLIEQIETLSQEGVVGIAKAINRSSQQVSQLVEKLILFSQLEKLNRESDLAIAMQQQKADDVAAIVASVAEQVANDFLRGEDLELQVEPMTVQMSAVYLRRICEELIVNAFKFSTESSPVKVVCSCQEQHLVLYVIDYGQGMTASQIEHIGAYLQFANDAGQPQQGIGLGLSIVKRLVELHDGDFLIESIPDQQTIVRITLPAV